MAKEAKTKKTNIMAILSLIFAFLFAPLGLIFGIISLVQIKKTQEGGKGLAIAGIIIAALGLFFMLVWFLMMGLFVARMGAF